MPKESANRIAQIKDRDLTFPQIDFKTPCSQTILVVEDNEGIRTLLVDVLQVYGYRVNTVTNGEEAMAYLAAHERPCAILLDLEMPVMNGWDFRKWQQQHPHFARIPVIIMSGALKNQLTYELLRPEAYLDKPIDFESLLQALRTKTNCQDKASKTS